MKSKEEAEEKLPDNVEYIEYNGFLNPSYLNCKKCGYNSNDWKIIPRNASKKTLCPQCTKSVAPLGNYKKYIPDTLTIYNFKDLITQANYSCSLCGYTGTVTVRNLRSTLKCKDCKNEGSSKQELKNQLLKTATNGTIEFMKYEGTTNFSTLVCNLCKATWEMKVSVISDNITCPECKYQYINEDNFKKLLTNAEIKYYGLPVNSRQKFKCTCGICKSFLYLSIRDIEKGKVCKNCEDENPRDNKKRCENFAELKKEYLTLITQRDVKFLGKDAKESEWKKTKGGIIDSTKYIWLCKRMGHRNVAKLSEIIKKIRENGNIEWCSECKCSTTYFNMKIMAEQNGWTLVVDGITTREDFQLSSNRLYKWICQNGHQVIETYPQFEKRNKCDECGGVMERIRESFINGFKDRSEMDDIKEVKEKRDENIEQSVLVPIVKKKKLFKIREQS
jgi:hypothetical protein